MPIYNVCYTVDHETHVGQLLSFPSKVAMVLFT